ncbi:transporter [Gimesia sp.]|uniref:transporter n=1 Tax=Gimesia sp. TaxID=2024833 RepID=UPI003A9463EF
MYEFCLRAWPGLFVSITLLFCAGNSLAETSESLFDQSLLASESVEVPEVEYELPRCRFLNLTPECGTLFQWKGSTGCNGGPQLDQPLQTDRPNFTSTSVTVGKGVTQLEFGYTYLDSEEQGADVKYQSFGEFLFRRGIVADWMEFRLSFSPLEQATDAGLYQNTTFGSQDLGLALQFALTPQQGILPEMALITSMSVPTGSSAFTANQVEPGIDLVYAWTLNDFVNVAASTQGYGDVDDSGESFLEIAQSCSVGYTLTEKLGAFTEWFVLIPSGARTARTEHYFDAGFTYLITNNLQLDLSAGVGLNDAADAYFVGAGCSIRFP